MLGDGDVAWVSLVALALLLWLLVDSSKHAGLAQTLPLHQRMRVIMFSGFDVLCVRRLPAHSLAVNGVRVKANEGETSGNERKKDGYAIGGATGGGAGGGGGGGGGPRKQRKEVPNAAEVVGKIEGTLPKAKGT